MGGLGRVWRVCNFMTQIQPNPTQPAIKKKFVTQPNPTYQALKTDPTQRVGLDQVGFGRLVDWLHTASSKFSFSALHLNGPGLPKTFRIWRRERHYRQQKHQWQRHSIYVSLSTIIDEVQRKRDEQLLKNQSKTEIDVKLKFTSATLMLIQMTQ